MSTLESTSSQQGMKTYLCRHTCGCKLRHSTEFTRSSVSSQGALWYHEHNDTLHPKHNLDCEYERYRSNRKIKDGKDKNGKDLKHDKARQNNSTSSSINGSSTSNSLQDIATTGGNVNSSNFMPIQPQQNYNNLYPKLLFQSYQKNPMGGKFNSQGMPVINGNADNITGGIRKDSNGSGSPTLQSMANLTSKSVPLYQEDQFKRKASLQDDQNNKRLRVAMEGITYPNQYAFDETQFLKAEIKELQEQIDFLKLQYIEQFLPKDKVDGNNYSNNINLLKRVVPQFLHDIWFKNCKNTTEYQKRVIEILTTIIEFFDPENNKNATASSPSIPNSGNENVQNIMNPGNIMPTENLNKTPTEETTAVVDDPLNHTIADTVSTVNAVNAVNAINAVNQAIDNNHFITNTSLNEDDLSNTNSSTIVANNIETLESINDTTKNPTIINIETVQAPPEITEAKAAELAAATPVIKLDPVATTTIDLAATLGSIKDDETAAATLNNTINELSQKTSIINSIQLTTQMAQAAPAAVKPETTLVATAAIPPTFALQATNEIDVMKK
ncbi:hypothetical protein BCR32DRAFT_278329 [Anaeromyces robustus]|uniref:Uncharacterized protein n=1 Tax=Anaeromyces robustus TaxID=1754192 RepID=A0A1Y1XBL1_9FUNG|nr:hypothetical protein BCR32DRAFT_278329 [Anaeromyces robustus]|eukprot:ORX83102.1 hypothetical protein BCR32DRAFT_278329 [Anaeromyces robustus]